MAELVEEAAPQPVIPEWMRTKEGVMVKVEELRREASDRAHIAVVELGSAVPIFAKGAFTFYIQSTVAKDFWGVAGGTILGAMGARQAIESSQASGRANNLEASVAARVMAGNEKNNR